MLNSAGQNNIRGINAQARAALFLFLQYLTDKRHNNFSHIHLEAPKFQDFNLVFSDRRKIICEVKFRKEKFNYKHLKEILKKLSSNREINEKDQILIVCQNVNSKLVKNVKNIRYCKSLEKTFLNKNYSKEMVDLLPIVNFWHVKNDLNVEAIFSLFSGLLHFWIPNNDVEMIVNNILVNKIYYGSEIGSTYSRSEILQEINNLAEKVKSDSTYYDKECDNIEKMVRVVEEGLANPQHKTWHKKKELSAFSAQINLFSFFTHHFRSKNSGYIKLKEWDRTWQLNNVVYFLSEILDVFENNLQTEENIIYVLSYFKKYVDEIHRYYYGDFIIFKIVSILKKIIKNNKEYLQDSFYIIKSLFSPKHKELFYLKCDDENRRFERENISELLCEIFDCAYFELKEEIVSYVISNFNLTKDDGSINLYAPKDIFIILQKWVDDDFENRFLKLIADLTGQFYEDFEDIHFNGWEYSGCTSCNWGGEYHVPDRHFVRMILIPSIIKFYRKDKNKGWEFVVKKCISRTVEVSRGRPDFLNRSVCEIVLERFSDSDHEISKEAFEILKEFILSDKGIPHKANLIYQEILRKKVDLTDEKKWQLVELIIQKYIMPTNVLVENIVVELVNKGFQKAKEQLKTWYLNPQYYTRSLLGHNYTSNIQSLLDSDIDFSLELLKIIITSDCARSEENYNFSGFLVAALVRELIKKDYNKGLSVLYMLDSEEKLSSNQQITYIASLFNTQGIDGSDDEELLFKIHRDVVIPFLEKYNTNAKILERLPNANSRELLVQFASKLAAKKQITEALRIVALFVNDPNPDKQSKTITRGNESTTIESVRGWCGWVLERCAGIDGRKNISETIVLVKRLLNDENYYVVGMACSALAFVAQNRLAVLKEDGNIFFLDDDKKTALEMAKDIEKLAFDLLNRFMLWPPLVQKAMAKKTILNVFSTIKSLNEQEALHLMTKLSSQSIPVEVMAEFADIFIYYAEFRKDSYKDWKLGLPGLYDDIALIKYEVEIFQELFVKVIERVKKDASDKCPSLIVSVEYMTQGIAKMIWGIEKCEGVAIKYFNMFADVYIPENFNLLYRLIKDNFSTSNHLTLWFHLLIKCLRVEKEFYEKLKASGELTHTRWPQTLYHSSILKLIYEKMGQDKFMQAARLYFFFPEEIMLHESEDIITIIRTLNKTAYQAEVQEITNSLFIRNPAKYNSLKKELGEYLLS